MPTYKLQYFDLRGRGELCRYVFHAAGREFEDERVTDWPSVKPSTPFGQIPVLTVDGNKTLAQSHSISRYLAREFGLAGKDSFEQGQCDQYIQLTEDFFTEMIKSVFEKDEEKKKELKKNVQEVVIPKFLGLFETALEKNGGKYLVGDALTVADLAVYTVFDTPLQNTPDVMDKYPKLKAQRAAIEAIPGIQKYIAGRKRTDL